MALKSVRPCAVNEELSRHGFPVTALREMAILRSVAHENVVGVAEVVVGRRELREVGLALEYCERDLSRVIDEEKIHYDLGQGE